MILIRAKPSPRTFFLLLSNTKAGMSEKDDFLFKLPEDVLIVPFPAVANREGKKSAMLQSRRD